MTIAGILAVLAVIRYVMPPLAAATDSVVGSNDALTRNIDHIITLGAVTMPDDAKVNAWVKNVGPVTIEELPLTSVQFGPESNPVPVKYGDVGCAAPCWWYDLGGGTSWAPGSTLSIHVVLVAGVESGSLRRLVILGPHGGQAAGTVRAP
jgi:hypothetical protein